MKTKKYVLCAAALLVCVFLSSCATQRYYGFETDNNRILLQGNITTKPRKVVKNSLFLDKQRAGDPYLSEKDKKRKQTGNFLVWLLDVNTGGKASDVVNTVKSAIPQRERRYESEIQLNDTFYALLISYETNEKPVIKVGDIKIDGNELLNDGKMQYHSFRIQQLPSWYQFEIFNLIGMGPFGTGYITSDDMPKAFTSFTVHDKKFTAYITSMTMAKNTEYHNGNFDEFFTEKTQVFQFLDENDNVWAEFTKDAYTLYAVDETFDSQLLWPCIAAYITIQDIVAETESKQ